MNAFSFNKQLLLLITAILLLSACKKNLPDNRLSISPDSQYNQYIFQPVLGRNVMFNNIFNYGNSSRPLNFKIVNMRAFNGDPAPELEETYAVKVWKTPYDGTEKSLEEIAAKQGIETHQLFEVREHSGDFLIWKEANSNMLRVQPDSGYVFDVEMTNSGGRKYFQNFKLQPFRERPYEPSNLNPITGQSLRTSVNPTYLRMVGKRDGKFFNSNDVQVLFNKIPKGTAGYSGHSLTFRFVDTLFNAIDPAKFAKTDWPNLVHGFNMIKDNTKVKYEIAYPLPLTGYPTKYTTIDGASARVIFRFNRLEFGNQLNENGVGLNFQIFEEGDWEIIFWFKGDLPNFDND
jgi:hypothetical protein